MKTIVGVEVQLRTFLTSAADRNEWIVSSRGHFRYGKGPQYQLGRATVEPTADMDTVGERKIAVLGNPNLIPRPSNQ
jgi:hypothetical protein